MVYKGAAVAGDDASSSSRLYREEELPSFGLIGEEHAVNLYGASKLDFERYLLDGRTGLDNAVVFRLSNVIGPGGDKFLDFLIGKMRDCAASA